MDSRSTEAQSSHPSAGAWVWNVVGPGLIVAGVDALTKLALDAARGDDTARDSLVRAVYDEVWQLCAALVDRQSADDLAQESFVRALRGLSRFRGDASARTWLFAVTKHTCMDELRVRHRRRRRDASRAALALGREPVAPDASQTSTVDDLLGRLDPERRAAFVLTQHLGLSYDEASVVCECATGTIRSRVARARAELIALLDAAEAEGWRRWPRRPTA